jgi:hypothetical protein
MLKRFIELAHCCRDVQNLHGHVRRQRRAQPVGRAATQGPLGEAVDQVGEAFDDARLLNLNKKRHEVDVLRCVRRCQRGEYVFAPHAEIDRFLWHAREPFDDAQLTALSNLCEPSSSGGRQRRRQRRRARSAQGRRRPADAGTRARQLRFVAPQHRVSPHRAVVARHRRHCRGRLAVCSASRRRRQPQEPGPQPSRLDARASAVQRHWELAAAGKQADLETERLLLKALAAKSVVELAREKTPPQPPPPLKQ